MINRDEKFLYPDIRTQEIPTQTPAIPGQVNQVAQTYGNALNSALSQPRQSYGQYLANRTGPPATDIQRSQVGTDAINAINSLWGVGTPSNTYNQFTPQQVQNYMQAYPQWNTQAPAAEAQAIRMFQAGQMDPGATPQGFNVNQILDTQGAYDASLAEADRRFKTTLMPALQESFGSKGLRYSSDFANAGARAYGDIQAQLGTQAARDQLAARQKVGDIGVQRAQLLGQFGAQDTALAQANQAKDFQEFLRMQPDSMYPAAQQFLGTRPIYPNVVTGGSPTLTQNPSQLDAVNQYLQAITNIAGAVPTVKNIWSDVFGS